MGYQLLGQEEGGRRSDSLIGMGYPFREKRKFWNSVVVKAAQHCVCTYCHSTVYF